MDKVARIPLIIEAVDRGGNPVDYKEVYKLLWHLQDQTRAIKNKTVQLLWEWNNFSSDYKAKYEIYPKDKDVFNCAFSTFAYRKLKNESDMNTGNLSCTIRAVMLQFKESKKDYMRGDRSILEYKSNQPIELAREAIRLDKNAKDFTFSIGLFERNYAQAHNLPTRILFKALIKGNYLKAIVERCYDNIYRIEGSKLVYFNKKWWLNLCYDFVKTTEVNLDKNKILGVDLGVAKPIVASVYGDLDRLSIDGGEIEHIRNKVEKRKKSLQRASAICGDGRKGHGYRTRVKPVLNIGDKEARCRDTINHKYSRALIDYAIKNECGVIQMEDLSGVTNKANHFLKNWSYYDLQHKVEYKAKEYGIEVVYVKPSYTSQRCSKCGYIHTENRPDQVTFKCLKCGFEANADYNASQNLAIKDIDKIICANMKST